MEGQTLLVKILSRRLSRECLLSVCFVFFGCWLGFFKNDISNGVMPSWFDAIPVLGHRFCICPFCGGMRAFVYVCRLEWLRALHYSILGTVIGIWIIASFPFRLCAFMELAVRGNAIWGMRFSRLECSTVFLALSIIAVCLQLMLHYFAGFCWFPLANFLYL